MEHTQTISKLKGLTVQRIAAAAIVIAALAIAAIYYRSASVATEELAAAQKQAAQGQVNRQAVEFTRLFIEKVLNADAEVSFDDRLKLETMVRDLKDNEVLAEWQQFLASKDEQEAQRGVRRLLMLLVSRIR